MKIQLWSDFVCPFCYIGKKRMQKAVKELGLDVEFEMMSFELDPNYVDRLDVDVHQVMADKYQIPYIEAEANNEYAAKMAKEVGLVYNHDIMKYSNTFKAHRVFQKAKELDKGNRFSEVLMTGFFTDGEYLNDDDTLIRLASEVGINRNEVLNALEDDSYALKVRQDQQWAQMIGAKGVPHFVLNDKVSLSGAQPLEVMKEALEFVIGMDDKPVEFGSQESGSVCTDDSCEI